jgi:hypothetical protein
VHQQIRSRILVYAASEGDKPPIEGSLEALLVAIRDAGLSLCIAGYSPIDPGVFVMAVDHHDKADDDSTTDELLELALKHGFEDTTVDRTPTWDWLPNEKGALHNALKKLRALDAEEVMLGATADNQTLVHARKRDQNAASKGSS